MEIIDLRHYEGALNVSESDFTPEKLREFGLKKVILLPDFKPGRSYLPVGTVALFDKETHNPFPLLLGRDIGCGMSLYKTDLIYHDLDIQDLVNSVDKELTRNADIEFTLGNHFIDFCKDKIGYFFFVLHAGFKQAGKSILKNGCTGQEYLRRVNQSVELAALNRKKLANIVYQVLGLDVIPPLLDKPHNTVQVTDEGFLYRKGAVELYSGESSILPSNLSHPIFLIKGKNKINRLENSFSHGTRRNGLIEELRIQEYDFNELRRRIKMPKNLTDEELLKLLPTQYDNFLDYANYFDKYISIEKKFDIIGYLGFRHT